MNNYSVALFLHIAGAMGFFAVLAIEWLGLQQIRSAISPEQVRAWMGIFKRARKVGFVSMLTTVISGFYMMDQVWGNVAWIEVTLGSLILVIVLSIVLTGPRMAAVGRALANEKGPLSHTFYSLTNHPLLWLSIQTRIAITLGIVFLKIDRPDLDRALLTISVATVLGLVSALPMPRREHAQAGAVD
jgi:hypothetical protein